MALPVKMWRAMPPRLAAISGKLKGAIFAINEETLVIGRESAANLCIADASVSRRHSQIEKKESGFVLTDLESLNGTFVNDVPVKSRLLEHGDRVRIGDSQFVFLTHEGDASSKSFPRNVARFCSQPKARSKQVLCLAWIALREKVKPLMSAALSCGRC